MRRGKTKMRNDLKILVHGGKKVNTRTDDSDTLQILDESDKEWVSLWQNAINKDTSLEIGITTALFSPRELSSKALKTRKRT